MQALVKYEGIPLSSAQLAVVKAWKRLDNPNQAQVAKVLNLSHQTVSSHMRKTAVTTAIAKAEQRQLDKAGGQLGKVLRTCERTIGLLDRLTDEQILDRPETAFASARTAIELAEKLHSLQEASSIFGSHVDSERYEKRARKLVARAYALGAGRRLLGWHPQDVVVEPDTT